MPPLPLPPPPLELPLLQAGMIKIEASIIHNIVKVSINLRRERGLLRAKQNASTGTGKSTA